jgi:hypothetical protein
MKRFAALTALVTAAGAGWYYLMGPGAPPGPVAGIAPGDARAQFPAGVKTEIVLKFDEDMAADPASDAKTKRVLFDVDPDGAPYLLVGRQLISAGRSAESEPFAVPLPITGRVSDFAFFRSGSPLLIEANRLAALTNEGIRSVQVLPQTGMRLTPAGNDACYLFGGDEAEQRKNLYLYRNGGELLHLLRAETPISAVAGDGEFTFVAIDKTVYVLALGSDLKAVLQTEDPITALAVGPQASLFFSTTAGIGFSDGANRGRIFMEGAGADIQVRGESLYLYFPKLGIMKCSPVNLFLKPADAL